VQVGWRQSKAVLQLLQVLQLQVDACIWWLLEANWVWGNINSDAACALCADGSDSWMSAVAAPSTVDDG
jgi:hypothetical protein